MNKSEFVAAVAVALNSTKYEAARAVEAVLGVISSTLSTGEEIRIVRFGYFKVIDVPAKVVRNPQNGQKIYIPASKRPKFVPGKDLKEAVNS